MALPTGDFAHFTFGGAVAGDTWSIGIWERLEGMSGIPTQSQADNAVASRLAGFNTTFWSATANAFKGIASTGTTLANGRVGVYRDGVLVQNGAANITPVAGTNSTAHPNYVALVATLVTASAGRSARGRVYLPATAIPISALTGLSNTGLQPFATNFAAHLTSYAATDTSWPGSPTSYVAVVSRTKASFAKIVTVRINDKPDTQRGRENKLTPSAIVSASV